MSRLLVYAVILGFAMVLFIYPVPPPAHSAPAQATLSMGYSLRFYGNGVNDIDRVKIKLDNPERPVDVGATDFTIEFWMKANPGDNSATTCSWGGDNWISGNIILDRDVYGNGDYGDYGLSLFQNGLAFGVSKGSSSVGLCGTSNLADGQWHHVAVQRRSSDGYLWLFVDGVLQAQLDGPDGDISYHNGRSTSYPNSDPYLVIGAEKHDAGSAYPSFRGWVDELRVSNILRYSGDFSPPTTPFLPDGNTVALYHFDEGSGTTVNDVSGASGGPSNGILKQGGSPFGPVWSTDTPFGPLTLEDPVAYLPLILR